MPEPAIAVIFVILLAVFTRMCQPRRVRRREDSALRACDGLPCDPSDTKGTT